MCSFKMSISFSHSILYQHNSLASFPVTFTFKFLSFGLVSVVFPHLKMCIVFRDLSEKSVDLTNGCGQNESFAHGTFPRLECLKSTSGLT